MPEVLSSIDDVFSTPEFSTALSECQHARMIAQDQLEQLSDRVAERYKDWGLGEYSASVEVDYDLQMSREEFADKFSDDDRALRLASLRTEAKTKEDEAKESVLEKGKEHGLGQFALYGLGLHMRDSGVIPKSALREKTSQAQQDFEVVDRFIRDNPGSLLTVMDSAVYTGRLGSGGINLDKKHGMHGVIIPVEGPCYAMSFMKNFDELHETNRIHLGTSDIHSIFGTRKVRIFDSWNPLLNITEAYDVGETTFAVGDPVEGPPYIPQERDRDFYQMVLERTRAVSRIALHNSK